jgi:DNA-binding XRE family transcriptional regulator
LWRTGQMWLCLLGERKEVVPVTRKTINTVERGVFVPSTVLALKLARVLEVTVEELFMLEWERPKEEECRLAPAPVAH